MSDHRCQIVGAGPGGARPAHPARGPGLEQADVLVWTDSLVNPQIAALAPATCERSGPAPSPSRR